MADCSLERCPLPHPVEHVCSGFITEFWEVANKDAVSSLTVPHDKYPSAVHDDANRHILLQYFVAVGSEIMIQSDSYSLPAWRAIACGSALAVLAFENYDPIRNESD